MLLKKIIKNCPSNINNIDINGLELDSRKVKKGNLFFALKGNKLNGEKFINQAIKKGAKAVVCSKNSSLFNNNIPIIKTKNPRLLLAIACAKFFKNKPKNIIAVTGTNGKTSVADFFYQIFSLNKIPVASIGTLGVKTNNVTKKLTLTSPDIISIHRELEKIKKTKIENVIIEASSHGLHQGRLDGVVFKAGIFTNFSQDHLDYHINMRQYFNAKMILFNKLLTKNKHIILNKNIKEFIKIKKIAIKKNLKIISISDQFLNKRKKLINLEGSFQLKNLNMAIKAAELCGLSKKKILHQIIKIKNINGRLELIKVLSNKAKIFVDYAHTPDALETVLKSLKHNYHNNITLVFGCGGERDIDKRSLMAKVADKFCNKIYVTDDNPRNENPNKIRQTIIKNLKKNNYFEIGNRAKAIKEAITKSEPFETIIIAGKGHENYQDYGNKIFKISDKDIIKNIKFNKNKFNKKLNNYNFNKEVLSKVLKKKIKHKFLGVTINSKEVRKNNLFIAIKGKNKDGHEFVNKAVKNGASYCIISKSVPKVNKKKLIKYKSTKEFLNKFALEKRVRSKSKIIAITGSVGKTTVKTLLGLLLNKYANTYFSPRSYNNHYGVPVSLSNLERDHKYGVFEVGMNKSGEIGRLSKLIKPDIAVITNIAEAHIENFKNIKAIAKAKAEIIDNISKTGILILNRDDIYYKYLKNVAKIKKIKTISFGKTNKSDVYPIYYKKIKKHILIKIKIINEILTLKVNDINIYNILSSLAVLKSLNLCLGKTVEFFKKFQPLEGRGKIHKIQRYKINFKLIDESYNANPLSVKNAIINLSKLKKNNCKKYLLLGDMLELGYKSEYYHRKLSKFINNTDIDKVFVYGNKILNTYKYTKKNKQGNILQCRKDFDEIFSKVIKKNDYLMIKGSNATGLNKISKSIIKGASYAV